MTTPGGTIEGGGNNKQAGNLEVSSTRPVRSAGCKFAARVVLTRVTLAVAPNRRAHYCLKHTRAVLAQARLKGLIVRDMPA